MCNKKVSIILPVYNGEKYISKSIDSILSQTYFNIELIIVNDCSTDNTVKIVEKFIEVDSRIKLVKNKSNLRLPRTLNVGFSNSTGDFLTWTSDDNIYENNAIETMVNALEEHSEYDMVYSNYSRIDENDKFIMNINLNDPDYLIYGNCVGACFLYRKSVYDLVGEYDYNLFLAEDYDYWIRIYRVAKILHINDFLYRYRVHGGSLTSTRKEQIDLQTYKVLEKNFLFLYEKAIKQQGEYAFFDNVLRRINGDRYTEIYELFKRINKGYSIYRYKRKFIEVGQMLKQIIKK